MSERVQRPEIVTARMEGERSYALFDSKGRRYLGCDCQLVFASDYDQLEADLREARDALRDLIDIEDRDNRTDPDIAATDEWREQAWNNARGILVDAPQHATCKWRRTPEWYLPSCDDGNADAFMPGSYCPYCGKRIEIMEEE